METPITPIQKLDTVLYILSLSPEKNLEGIQAYLKDNYSCDLNLLDIRKVVRRLEKDGYTEFFSGDRCRITFDGEVFKDAGGYNTKSLADAADAEQQRLEISRLKFVDASNDQNQKTLNILTGRLVRVTWWAFGAALFAALIGLAVLVWQIYSFYNTPPTPVITVKIKK